MLEGVLEGVLAGVGETEVGTGAWARVTGTGGSPDSEPANAVFPPSTMFKVSKSASSTSLSVAILTYVVVYCVALAVASDVFVIMVPLMTTT